MTTSYHPPSIAKLVEIDISNAVYGDEAIEIVGIVSPSSQGGWPAADDYDVHTFEFAKWRQSNSPLAGHPLTILRPVPTDVDKFSAFSKYTLHRATIFLSDCRTRAILVESHPLNNGDVELIEIVEKLQKPQVVSTTHFGDLSLNGEIGWFEGEAEWIGQFVQVAIECDDDLNMNTGLATAEDLWRKQSEWNQKAVDFSVQNLLPIKNEGWLDEGEQPITADEFRARMNLQSISFDKFGEFTFWFNDGDLFWGHSIFASGDPKKGITDANIAG